MSDTRRIKKYFHVCMGEKEPRTYEPMEVQKQSTSQLKFLLILSYVCNFETLLFLLSFKKVLIRPIY